MINFGGPLFLGGPEAVPLLPPSRAGPGLVVCVLYKRYEDIPINKFTYKWKVCTCTVSVFKIYELVFCTFNKVSLLVLL